MFSLCAHCSYNAERRTAPHPPPMAVPLPRRGRSCVIPFIYTGDICHAPGTAHRPFPTVSLTRPLFQPTWFKSARLLTRAHNRNHAPKRENCQLSIVHCQFSFFGVSRITASVASSWVFLVPWSSRVRARSPGGRRDSSGAGGGSKVRPSEARIRFSPRPR